MGINKINVPRRINLRKRKETKNVLVSAITAVRRGTSLQTTGNMKQIKTRGPRIGRKKKTWRYELQMLRTCCDVPKQVQSNMKLTRFCLKSICENLHFRSLIKHQYPAIHLMVAKIIRAILIWKKSKKMAWLVKRFKWDKMLFKQD